MQVLSQIIIPVLLLILPLTAAEKVVISTITDDRNNEAVISQASPGSQIITDFGERESLHDNSALIEQAGNRNITELIFNGNDNRIESRQNGNDNQASMNIAGSNKTIEFDGLRLESAVLVQQDGDHNSANITIESGDDNGAVIYQFGDKSIATILQQNGGGNRAWIEQGDRDHAVINQSGNQNIARIMQNQQ